ncbi:MAG: GGDEF domain-containing protein [Lachnospiraceae bacterium]|nr:GGDEF domain-containing protein [Lachnospiraceae bacterium]
MINMHDDDENRTVLLNGAKKGPTGNNTDVEPRLFVCFEHEIMEFPLAGRQLVGRPSKDRIPDIPVTNKYVSRQHGVFETAGGKVTYTPAESINGTLLGKKKLEPGEAIKILDGDELIIPASDEGEGVDVMLVCALSESRINIWRDLMISSRDTLTGLPGRNAFRTWYLMNHSWNTDAQMCVFILDIDKFKTINDTYGHAAGDKALKILSNQLRNTAGTTGYICRWGGDEFTGILAGDARKVKQDLDNMRIRIGKQKIDGRFYMTISAGIIDVRSVGGVNDLDRLVTIADKALYKAKENGRDCVCIAKVQKMA